MQDIERLTKPDAAKLAGVIAGRALYDGRIDAKRAMELLAER
jgi:phosphoribosylformimino-5-aminoimidazole carboxamide ribotide isomerase